MNKKHLYLGGIFGPIVFLINDIVGSIITPGYSPIINAVSELTQRGAENSILLSLLFLIAAVGLVLFAIGIALHYSFGKSKLLFFGGIFIGLLGIFSALTGTIFPMDPFGEAATFAGEMHKYLTYVNILLVVLGILMIGIGFNKQKKWKSFLIYSIVVVLIMGTFGALTSVLMMNGIELLGLFERITIYGYQSWILILSVSLIREEPKIKVKNTKFFFLISNQ
ncbi:MAG: DUF998 domain-containing protein [Candidatus Lokiarchaeota archaeon]|nr:DUF998 domain-containing protein [Candidatus Lokiarchaeota archaeon]